MLGDVRILEMAQGLAGPVAGLMLAECGADVLKIEPPGGDPGRISASFATWNRSKRSLELDPETPPGRARLAELLGGADVLIHDLPPSKASALGLDDASLARTHPRLIVCSVLGSPIHHADAERSSDELLVQARSGLLDEQDGFRDGPIVYRYPIGGWGAAHLAAAGVLVRLLMRRRTGLGGGVHTSLLQGLMAPMSLVWGRNDSGPLSARPPRLTAPPQIQLYQCSCGGWLQIMDPTGRLDYAALPLMWEVMAETELHVDDPVQLRAAFRHRAREDWLKVLREADVAVEPSLSLGDALTHPEAAANTYVVDVDDAVWGKTRQAATPLDLSTPVKVRGPAPRLGEHGDVDWNVRAAADAGAQSTEPGPYPLSGLKVVDLGAFLAGPMAPSMLGDLGADVIKVESLSGDRMRFMTRYFQAAARNKRSIAVDLTKPEGQEVLRRLALWADVVHHNMRIRAASKIGADEAGLRRHNPNLVFGYVSAYGLHGERANWPGYDSVFQALGGWEVENAGEGNPPLFMRAGTMDVLCALNSLVGTLAALYQRGATGVGASAASSLLGVACLTQSETLVRSNGEMAPRPRLDAAQTGEGPTHRIYQAVDGWIAVAATGRGEEAALCRAFGVAQLADLETAAVTQSCDRLLTALEREGVAADRVLLDAYDKIFDDPANQAAQVVVAYPHPEYGRIEHPGAFWRFNDAELRLQAPLPPPLLGEHTHEIMTQLGYSAEEIEHLRQIAVIGG